MKNFKEGDRVTHRTYGAGTVNHPYPGTGQPTVQFDNGGKYMTADYLLTPIPSTVPAPFKIGDRVFHQLHGTATVLDYDAARKLVEIEPDRVGTTTVHVHPVSLTDVGPTPKFKIGDRVASTRFDRVGTVETYSPYSGLYLIDLPGGRAYYALENQITAAVPETTYHICIEEITGAAHVPGNLTAKQVADYITDNVDWRVVVEIKITKEGDR